MQLHLYAVDLVGVVLRFSSMVSCANTRGGTVESPIRLFFTQQIASYGRAMGRAAEFSH